MPIQLNPKQDQVASLRKIAAIGTDLLDKVVRALNDVESIPLTASELIELIQAIVPNQDDAETIVEQGLSLYGVVLSTDASIEEVAEALDSALHSRKENWWTGPIKEQIFGLIKSASIRAVTKATSLAYEHAHLFRSAKMITDVRPIFDSNADEIDGAIISHNLRLEYFGRSGPASISITLDTPDLHQLLRQCERGLKKAKLTRSFLREGHSINAIILGDSSGESMP